MQAVSIHECVCGEAVVDLGGGGGVLILFMAEN